MRFDPETPAPLHHPDWARPDWAGIEGDVNGMLSAKAWARRQAQLSRWALRDAALIQLGLAMLTWSFVALLIRWSFAL